MDGLSSCLFSPNPQVLKLWTNYQERSSSQPGLQEQRRRRPKREKIQRAMLPRSAILQCTHAFHWARVCTIKRWYAVPKSCYMIVYVEHNPEVSSTMQETNRPMPLYCWLLNMKFSLILVVIVWQSLLSIIYDFIPEAFCGSQQTSSLKKPRALLFGQKKVFDNGISIQRSMAPFDLGCCLGVISDA